ncbi:MAG: RNA pyrophosphohydrolase [Rickettsia endosymbiont of Bryobia graminum]|nr:RNA pyrophosphohydrolase [Rickettsia endosymbiont of Bryobia graminum]
MDSNITTNYRKLPYRPGVGMMIIDKNSNVFVGKRIDTKIQAWQMPQGGINLGETPSVAALREMLEEIGCNKGTIIAESKYWYSYDLPQALIPKLWGGNFRGQKQKWFLIKFTGTNEEININTLAPEFEEWHWAELDELLSIIIPFKRKLYKAVIKEFSVIINNHKSIY